MLYRTVKVTNEDGTSTEYTYDAAGNRLSITYPDGNAVTTNYDVLGQITALTDHDGTGILYTRDAEGRVTKETYSDGSTTEYTYNAAGLLTLQKEVANDNSTRRQIVYAYDDAGNLTSENRSGVGIEKADELVRYYYDKADQLVKTNIEGVTTSYSYDKAGNLLSDGENTYTYTYDIQNRLLTKTNSEGTVSYAYDKAGNLLSDGTTTYTYSAQNRLIKGETASGDTSEYVYNALGVRIANIQIRENKNAGNQNATLMDGSHGVDYTQFLKDGRATWQRAWETVIGTTVQNETETVTRHYTIDYLSLANRDIYVIEDGSYTTRYVYDEHGTRISAEFDYAPGTHRGEAGENLQSDIAVSIGKVFYRTSILGSTLFAVDKNGDLIAHAIYDPWGNPLTETYTDTNFSGLENLNNFTGYIWDETLGLYYAQNRFYDAGTHRFTQEDAYRGETGDPLSLHLYAYCCNNPIVCTDPSGNSPITVNVDQDDDGELDGQNRARVRQIEAKQDERKHKDRLLSTVEFVESITSSISLTYSIGLNLSGTLGIFPYSIQGSISIDGNGNIVFSGTISTGVTTGCMGGAITFTQSLITAKDLRTLSGETYQVGGSYGAIVEGVPLVASGDFVIIPDAKNPDKLYIGIASGAGIGSPGKEFHITSGATHTFYELNIYDLLKEGLRL